MTADNTVVPTIGTNPVDELPAYEIARRLERPVQQPQPHVDLYPDDYRPDNQSPAERKPTTSDGYEVDYRINPDD